MPASARRGCRLTAIFIDSASPLSPTWVTFGPMSCSSGFSRSNVSLRPPTMTDSLPCCSVITLPETGASTMSAPFSRTLAASARLTAGLTVLMSMWNFPVEKPASNPSGPSVIAVRAVAFVTIVKVTSAFWATARGEVCPLHASIDQPLRFGTRSVVPGNRVAFFKQASHHVPAHHPEADESEIRH